MKRSMVLFILLLLLSATACSSGTEPTVDAEPVAVATTVPNATAVPTDTSQPATNTPAPTSTSPPTSTPLPEPTATAVPTDTPAPTATEAGYLGVRAIAGVVFDSGGQPLANAQVDCVGGVRCEPASATTGADGSFGFVAEMQSPLAVQLKASHPDFVSAETVILPAQCDNSCPLQALQLGTLEAAEPASTAVAQAEAATEEAIAAPTAEPTTAAQPTVDSQQRTQATATNLPPTAVPTEVPPTNAPTEPPVTATNVPATNTPQPIVQPPTSTPTPLPPTPTETPAPPTATPLPTSTPPPPSTPTPSVNTLASLANLPDDTPVTVEGTVVFTESFSRGFKFTLDDGTGRAVLLFWDTLYAEFGSKPQLNIGAQVRVRGAVGRFDGELQVTPYGGNEVVVLQPGYRAGTQVPTGQLSGASGQRVRITGEIVDIFTFDNGNTKITINDGSGAAVVWLWSNIWSGVPNSGAYGLGRWMEASGVVDSFNGEFQVQPVIPYDVALQ